MKKLLFIGNSHLATIKTTEKWSDHQVDFIGFSLQADFNIDLFENTTLGDGIQIAENSPDSQKHLWTITTGSSSSLDLDPYDAYFIVGILRPPNPWKNFCHFESYSHENNLPPISYDCYLEIVKSNYAEELCLASSIQSVIKKRNKDRLVFYIPLPYIREDADSFNKELAPPAHWMRLSEEAKEKLVKYEAINYRKALKSFGLELLMPPANLQINGNRCPSKYSNGALGSANFTDTSNPAWGDGDLLHKNQEYGKEWWIQINTMLVIRAFNKSLSHTNLNISKIKTSSGSYIFLNENLNSCVHTDAITPLAGFRSVYCLVTADSLKLFFIGRDDQLVELKKSEAGCLSPSKSSVLSPPFRQIITNGYLGFGIIDEQNKFLCANPDGSLSFSREEQHNWETFNIQQLNCNTP